MILKWHLIHSMFYSKLLYYVVWRLFHKNYYHECFKSSLKILALGAENIWIPGVGLHCSYFFEIILIWNNILLSYYVFEYLSFLCFLSLYNLIAIMDKYLYRNKQNINNNKYIKWQYRKANALIFLWWIFVSYPYNWFFSAR